MLAPQAPRGPGRGPDTAGAPAFPRPPVRARGAYRPLLARFLGACLFLCALAGPAAAQDRPTVQAVKTAEAPRIDGILNDAVWARAVPIEGLTQVEPREGLAPTEQTEIRFLYDADHLYIGMRFHDSRPAEIVSKTRERDAFLEVDDRFELILDTYHDKRNAFFFQMSAAGSKGDALVTNNGSGFNKPWDGIWEGRTTIDEGGWSAEVALPFKTLSFEPGLTTWGFNIQRYLGRLREESRWSSPRQNIGLFQVAEAGTLTGLEGIRQGVGLDVSPFFVGRYENDRVNDDESHLLGQGGLDAFYKLTPNLTFALTINTDFAETEVDDRRINFTRFPLFFEERRDFFLQDAGQFEFADLGNDLIPFFSRRIGLVDGEEVPIVAGAKLTGRAGEYNLGVLDVQTDEEGNLDEQNLFAARVSRNVGEQSTVGGIVTAGTPDGGADNVLYGLDYNYRTSSFQGDKNLRSSVWFLQTDTEDLSSDDVAYGASIDYPNNVWRASATFKEVQQNFNPELGFLPRSDMRKYTGSMTYRPRINEDIRFLEFGLDGEIITDTGDDFETSYVEVQPIGFELESGDSMQIEIDHTREDLDESFDISDVLIPVDDYSFTRYRYEYRGSDNRPLAVNATAEGGDFFDGTRERYNLGLLWHTGPLFSGELEYEYNDLDQENGDLITRLFQLRVALSFSQRLSWNNTFQWDSETDRFGWNSRLRFIPQPGNDLYIVFNESAIEQPDHDIVPEYQEFAVKVVYTIRF